MCRNDYASLLVGRMPTSGWCAPFLVGEMLPRVADILVDTRRRRTTGGAGGLHIMCAAANSYRHHTCYKYIHYYLE
jgi:hypothetical protein